MVAKTTTPDGVIADNITRIREAKGWTQTQLAERLGRSKHVVLDYEGRRKGRRQRPFRWSELIELCYLLDVTLYELVLPADRDTEIDIVSQSEAMSHLPAVKVSLGSPGSKDLGLRLFGVPGDDLLEADKLKTFAGVVAYASDQRRENLKKFLEGLVTFAQDLADSGFRTLQEAVEAEEE